VQFQKLGDDFAPYISKMVSPTKASLGVQASLALLRFVVGLKAKAGADAPSVHPQNP